MSSDTREQRLAGIRERAEVELEKWVNTPEGGKIVMIAFGDSKTPMLAFAAAFADSERERVLLEAAKAVCPWCQPNRGQDWQPMSTAPENTTEIRVKMKDGTIHERAHWASDLTGEEQPSFQGWFIPRKDGGFAQIERPQFWQPIPEAAPLSGEGGERKCKWCKNPIYYVDNWEHKKHWSRNRSGQGTWCHASPHVACQRHEPSEPAVAAQGQKDATGEPNDARRARVFEALVKCVPDMSDAKLLDRCGNAKSLMWDASLSKAQSAHAKRCFDLFTAEILKRMSERVGGSPARSVEARQCADTDPEKDCKCGGVKGTSSCMFPPQQVTVIPPIIERLRKFAQNRPERLDFDLQELMRDAENAVTTAETMSAAWRKRAEESEAAFPGSLPTQPKRKMRASPLDDIHDECPDCRGTCSPVEQPDPGSLPSPAPQPDIMCKIGEGKPKSFIDIVKAYRLNQGWQEGADLDAALVYIEKRERAGPKPSPRCPKCGSGRLSRQPATSWVECQACNETWSCVTVADFAQFFTPSAGEPEKKI